MTRTRITPSALAVAALFLFGDAHAQTQNPPPPSAEPDVTTSTYGDWLLRCHRQEKVKNCEITQTLQLQLQGQAQPVAIIGVARDPAAAASFALIVQVPVNVFLKAGVSLSAGEPQPFILPFQTCVPAGCFARMQLETIKNALLFGGNESRVTFKDAGQNEVALPFSLKGFSNALAALEQQS